MKFILSMIICISLTSCAVKLLSSSERSVIVQARMQDAAQAQKLADAECAKYGRHARLALKPHVTQYVFDCVN
jgi:hypothetical protein